MSERRGVGGRFEKDPTAKDYPGVGRLGAYVVDNFWTWYRVAESGCWEWTKSVNNMGYGQQRVHGGRTLVAHRIAWVITNGSIPYGLSVLHKCDNPRCINPSHLFLGTQTDNIRDAVQKGRHGRGDGPAPMFTAAQAAEVRDALGTQREIAKRFGVAQNVVGRIKRGTYRPRSAHV